MSEHQGDSSAPDVVAAAPAGDVAQPVAADVPQPGQPTMNLLAPSPEAIVASGGPGEDDSVRLVGEPLPARVVESEPSDSDE